MNATLEMPAPAMQLTPAKPAKSRILLVDDDPAIRQLLHRLLGEENYFVLTAANGIEALELDKAVKFDLVLLDLNMPINDGWGTFKQLSARHPQLPIILIIARPKEFFPALASGVGVLMDKPLDFVKLIHTIRDLLEEPTETRLARHQGSVQLGDLKPNDNLMFSYDEINGVNVVNRIAPAEAAANSLATTTTAPPAGY